jgi:DNA polymerase-4/protein ImuB
VGLADGKFVARVAALLAAPGRVRRVPPGAAPRFLATLPVSVLPVAPEVVERLGLFGLRRLGDLAGLPLGAVQAQFGSEGRRAWRLARGLDDTPLLPQDFPIVLQDRFAFDPPVVTRDVVALAARHLLGRLVEHPLFQFRAARGLTFRAHTGDGQTWERRLTFRQPLSDPERMLLALRGKLAAFAPTAPVEAVALALTDLCAEGGTQASLPIAQRVGDRQQLREAIHQLRSHYGYSPIAKIVEVEPWSRIPERRRALIDYDP